MAKFLIQTKLYEDLCPSTRQVSETIQRKDINYSFIFQEGQIRENEVLRIYKIL